jgi:N-acetylglucosamine kinase-like BadF-type ATPase
LRDAFPIDNFFHEDFEKVPESLKGCAREVIEYAYKVKHVVEVVASVSPFVMDMANAFATVIPRLLEAALRFDNLISSILSLMKNRTQIYGELASKEVQSKYEKLE